jgi:branched-chain amino acid transport system permease protein
MIGGFELLRELDWLKAIFGNDFDPHTAADLRLRHGADHDLEAARPDLGHRARPSAFLKEKKRPSSGSSRRATADHRPILRSSI